MGAMDDTGTTLAEEVHPGPSSAPRHRATAFVMALGLTAPALVLRVGGVHSLPHPVEALLFGIAVVGASFLLAWAAEAAQLDIGAGLAIAVLALIAVLPEYAVDAVFAWKSGHGFKQFGRVCHAPGATGESPCSLALANMTGSNRLLIGIGWSMVVAVAWWQWRKRKMPDKAIVLPRLRSVEIGYLTVATMYALTLPLRRSLTLIDAAVLVLLFAAYTRRVAGGPSEEPHLVGPAQVIGSLAQKRRRITVVVMLVFAAIVILASAEPFAEALVATGRSAHINEFLLVQWLAPLASEAPELLVAGLFAWRLNTDQALSTLVSSKVNQWTLLVGTLPIIFAISSGSWHGLPLGVGQRDELLLTAAQAAFAVAVLASLSLSIREAVMLFSLFWAQFIVGAFVPTRWHGSERIVVSIAYLGLAVVFLFRQRGAMQAVLRDGFLRSYDEMAT